MLQHVSSPELGDLCSAQEYTSVYARSLDDVYDNRTVHTCALDHIIDLSSLTQSFVKAKTGKASDAHHMKAELVKAASKESAALWLPLVFSTIATRQEPASCHE
eukprot:11946610-Karenia_brevis.AAC.1